MKMRLVPCLVCCIAASLLASPTDADTVITFDDIAVASNQFIDIPNGYQGLNWNNFEVLNTVGALPSGYINGTVSGTNVAFNDFGDMSVTSSGSPFNLISGEFTGAWNDGLDIEVLGFTGGFLTNFSFFTVDTSGPTLETLDFFGVDTVDFYSFGGVHHDGYQLYGTQFVLDNLTVSGLSVPEPGTLLLTSIASACLLGRRVARGRGNKVAA